jgi:hypothetical protein
MTPGRAVTGSENPASASVVCFAQIAGSRAVVGDRRWRSPLAQDEASGIGRKRWWLSAGALAVPASWPAAGPALAFLQLLLGPAEAAFPGHLLLGILDPADELGSGQGRAVLPGTGCRLAGDQRLAQVCGKLVHDPAGHALAAHKTTVTVQGPACFTSSAAPGVRAALSAIACGRAGAPMPAAVR